MIPALAFDRSIVAVRQDELVNALLELTAPIVPVEHRAPLDIVAVIDRSGSMAGEPLRAVCDAVAGLLRVTGPDDRIGVVTFDDQVHVVLPLARHDRDVAERTVRAISSGGSTNLSAGWLKGVELLEAAPRPDAVRRVVLLTDGHANHGVTGRDQLASLVRGATARDVSSSFIGFAHGYDEELLAALADAGRGNDYFCADADAAAAVFGQEFTGLAAVAAQNLSVEIRPSAQVAAMRVRHDFPAQQHPDGGLTVQIGDAYSGETRRLLVELSLRPVHDHGPVDIATMTVKWAAVVGTPALHSVVVPVVVHGGTADEITEATADPRVVEAIAVLDGAAAQRAARELAQQGEFGQASALLRSTAQQLRYVGLVTDADQLDASASEIEVGGYDAASSKRLWSLQREKSRGRRSNFDTQWDRTTGSGTGTPGDPTTGSPTDPAGSDPL
ncbi:MAG: vWA domain-containing protein [Ilumatobacteraceae bacterium]